MWSIVDSGICMPKHGDSVGLRPPDIDEFKVEYNEKDRTYTVTYPECYSLMRSGDPSPDDLVNASASIRRGTMMGSCRFRSVEDQEHDTMRGTMKVEFQEWDAHSTDRIELTLKGCCGKGD